MRASDVRITILVDNKAKRGLSAEHGLSLWIEVDGNRILFDTGQGPALGTNAERLGIDLSLADMLVLSHGHYDHTGGVPDVIGQAGGADVYFHPGVLQPRYAIREKGCRSIGIPEKARMGLERLPGGQVHLVREPRMLTERAGVTGPVPRENDYEDLGGPFYLDPEGTRPDALVDDLALWIRSGHGAIVCLGCAHAGPVNTLDHVIRLAGVARVRAVIGGLHLVKAGEERLARTVAALEQLGPDLLVPCHCTGEEAVMQLRGAFGAKVSIGAAGGTYEF